MTYERTVKAHPPKPAAGRRWLAAALLEAPDYDGRPGGAWAAVEAQPVVEDLVPDTLSTRYAQHDPGWYRIQWYDDGQNSVYSEPVQLGGAVATHSGRWN